MPPTGRVTGLDVPPTDASQQIPPPMKLPPVDVPIEASAVELGAPPDALIGQTPATNPESVTVLDPVTPPLA